MDQIIKAHIIMDKSRQQQQQGASSSTASVPTLTQVEEEDPRKIYASDITNIATLFEIVSQHVLGDYNSPASVLPYTKRLGMLILQSKSFCDFFNYFIYIRCLKI